MTLPDLVVFLVFVAPGFLAVQVYNAIYPARDRAPVETVGWSLIIGIAISLPLQVIGVQLPKEISAGTAVNIAGIAVLMGSGVVVGLLVAGQQRLRETLRRRVSWLAWMAPDPRSVWAKVNAHEHKDWAVVYTSDGAIYRGYIKSYQFDPNLESQDFLLARAARVDDHLKVLYNVSGQGVYFSTRDVRRIEFEKGRSSPP